MADYNQRPVEANLLRRRADTFPVLFTLTDAAGDPVDVTGWTFLFTVDENPDPPEETDPSSTEVFQRAGVVQDGPGGIVRVGPFDAADVGTLGDFFYDLQAVDTSGNIRTIARGQFSLEQDITKD